MTIPTLPRWIDAAKAPASTPPPLEGDWAPVDTRLDDSGGTRCPAATGRKMS